MTNKPMLSVERELLDLVTDNRHIDKESISIRRWEAICRLRAILSRQVCAKCGSPTACEKPICEDCCYEMPAAQRQGEPVACLVRNRNLLTQASIAVDGKDHFGAWSAWDPCSIEYGRAVTDPLRNEHVCYEMELLFKEKPAPVAPFSDDTVVCRRYQLEQNPGQNFYHYDLEPVYGSVPVTISELITLAERAPVAVVMPERKTKADYSGYIEQFQSEAASLYNSALDDVARLNGVKP